MNYMSKDVLFYMILNTLWMNHLRETIQILHETDEQLNFCISGCFTTATSIAINGKIEKRIKTKLLDEKLIRDERIDIFTLRDNENIKIHGNDLFSDD